MPVSVNFCATDLMSRGDFVENSLPTVGAAFLTQTLHVEGRTLKLEIWDTAGQEKFAALAPLYYHGAHIAIVVSCAFPCLVGCRG